MRIGVISDTHGVLRPEAEALLAGVEHIIHAGDIGSPDIIPRLRRIAPVTAIRGNVDVQEWASEFQETAVVTLAGRSIYVLHDLGDLQVDPATSGVDVVIAGHSHRPSVKTVDDVSTSTPGAPGGGGSNCRLTLATLELAGDTIRPAIHELVP